MSGSFVRRWMPPALRDLANRWVGAATTYVGPYSNWAEASAATEGYDADAILARVVAATQAVLDGQAAYEQDGCPMQGTPPPSHALAALLASAAESDECLQVVDFGGGLASHWLRWRPFLAALREVHWTVIEQPHFVREGTRLFAGMPQVRFAASPDEIDFVTDVVLASSVLQYLDAPLAAFDRLLALGPRTVILDRTPFADDGVARVAGQRVPKALGRASYPLWLLSQDDIARRLDGAYAPIASWTSDDRAIAAPGLRGTYRGGAWRRTP